mgnify:CR=1 FL=1
MRPDTDPALRAEGARIQAFDPAFVQANVARQVFDPLLLEHAMSEALRDVAVSR